MSRAKEVGWDVGRTKMIGEGIHHSRPSEPSTNEGNPLHSSQTSESLEHILCVDAGTTFPRRRTESGNMVPDPLTNGLVAVHSSKLLSL